MFPLTRVRIQSEEARERECRAMIRKEDTILARACIVCVCVCVRARVCVRACVLATWNPLSRVRDNIVRTVIHNIE